MNREKMIFVTMFFSGVISLLCILYALAYFIPFPVIIIGGIVIGAVAGWLYEGSSATKDDQNQNQNTYIHPADSMSEEERRKMYEEWINKK